MIDDGTSRLLMSDFLKGQVPSLETDSTKSLDDNFIIVVIEFKVEEGSDRLLLGSLAGFGSEEAVVKIDIRVTVVDAFAIVKRCLECSITECDGYQLHLGENMTRQQGPFRMMSPKVMDFDHANKMCTLAVDLIRA